MPTCIDVFVEYFKKEIPLLENSYQWKIPDAPIGDFDLRGQKGFQPNVELKHNINRLWTTDLEDKASLANYIIKDWGGVKTNKPETIKSYVQEAQKQNPGTEFKGIASYSKLFAIMNLEKYAIYDARVASCLNAIQVNGQTTEGLAFNYPPGRNNTTGNTSTKKGFSQDPRFKISTLANSSGWKRIKRDDTYNTYLDLLNKCLKKLPSDTKIYELEMALFSNAEKECTKAMR